MIRSMTGYGRAQKSSEEINISVEIKSVNHRYFEYFSKIPRLYSFLDEKVKSLIQQKVTRGKIECSVYIESFAQGDCTVEVNDSLASGYLNAFSALSEKYGIENDVKVSTLSRYNDIFSVHKQEADEERIWAEVEPVLSQALEAFISMREKEGEKLRKDVLSRCEIILKNVEFIEQRSPETVREYQQKLLERMSAVLESTMIDESRILTEAAIYADKVAVAEETVRLRSHIAQMKEFMESSVAIGKKTDFLVQEFNREANTIGSKCQDIEISRRVIDIKAEIEKIREQIQNIE